jgi:hypothetical protein
LIDASISFDEKIIIMLIDAGADWNMKNDEDHDFLHYLNNEFKLELQHKYPEKYEEYLKKKQIKKFKI